MLNKRIFLFLYVCCTCCKLTVARSTEVWHELELEVDNSGSGGGLDLVPGTGWWALPRLPCAGGCQDGLMEDGAGGVGLREADLRGWKMSSQSAGATQTQLTGLNVEMNNQKILSLS